MNDYVFPSTMCSCIRAKIKLILTREVAVKIHRSCDYYQSFCFAGEASYLIPNCWTLLAFQMAKITWGLGYLGLKIVSTLLSKIMAI